MSKRNPPSRTPADEIDVHLTQQARGQTLHAECGDEGERQRNAAHVCSNRGVPDYGAAQRANMVEANDCDSDE
ncbi:MAG: hypothetical protein EBT46_00785 [Actinobacteria bacterium]|nr:hypothetical protein [Actinomycetota bacterium]